MKQMYLLFHEWFNRLIFGSRATQTSTKFATFIIAAVHWYFFHKIKCHDGAVFTTVKVITMVNRTHKRLVRRLKNTRKIARDGLRRCRLPNQRPLEEVAVRATSTIAPAESLQGRLNFSFLFWQTKKWGLQSDARVTSRPLVELNHINAYHSTQFRMSNMHTKFQLSILINKKWSPRPHVRAASWPFGKLDHTYVYHCTPFHMGNMHTKFQLSILINKKVGP